MTQSVSELDMGRIHIWIRSGLAWLVTESLHLDGSYSMLLVYAYSYYSFCRIECVNTSTEIHVFYFNRHRTCSVWMGLNNSAGQTQRYIVSASVIVVAETHVKPLACRGYTLNHVAEPTALLRPLTGRKIDVLPKRRPVRTASSFPRPTLSQSQRRVDDQSWWSAWILQTTAVN